MTSGASTARTRMTLRGRPRRSTFLNILTSGNEVFMVDHEPGQRDVGCGGADVDDVARARGKDLECLPRKPKPSGHVDRDHLLQGVVLGGHQRPHVVRGRVVDQDVELTEALDRKPD